MKHLSLGNFIAANRDEILRRCQLKVRAAVTHPPSDAEIARGIPVFLDDVVAEFSGGPKTPDLASNAIEHGSALFREGLTVAQVVQNYGAFCQAVTDLAVEVSAPISANDFRTLNQCLDDATANAVSEYSRHVRLDFSAKQSMTLYNLVETAISDFEELQRGKSAMGDTTGARVYRSLKALRAVVSGKELH
jgi:hypothetical protein